MNEILRTFIIAEAGINHDGDVCKAKELATAAHMAGASAVKFQTFIADTLALDEEQFKTLSRYQLGFPEFRELKAHCDRIGIEFISTPFCPQTAQFLNAIGVRRFKISSGNATNMALIKLIASFRKEVILSLGMTTLEEKQAAVATLLGYGMKPKDVVLMYCRSQYPATEENVHLGNLRHLLKHRMRVGFSDHTKSTNVPVLAVAMGAEVIEKHFTLWPAAPGADHAMSVGPEQFEQMVEGIRRAEGVMSYGPQITQDEKLLRDVWIKRVEKQNGK